MRRHLTWRINFLYKSWPLLFGDSEAENSWLYGGLRILRFFDAAAEGLANYNELINMLHKLIFNARSVNFAWFIWGPYAIFGLIFLIDFTCLQSMEEVKTLNKWDISGEFSNTVDYIVIPGGGTDHHIFSSSLIISGVTVNVKLSISIHRDFYESCYLKLLSQQ